MAVPNDAKTSTQFSSYYNDYKWRKDKAVYGYLISTPQYNCTDDIKYRYGDKVVVTHVENF